MVMINSYQAKYFAYELSKRCSSDDAEKFSGVLLDAKVELNPHQVEAALFAFKSPLSKGAILADEVGLGKTIEAGILLSQKWAEGRKKILIISPSSLRKQWSQELADKFYLPSNVLETKSFNAKMKKGKSNPFESNEIVICSYHFARNKADFLQLVSWDLVVFDEAHYLRNVYKKTNKISNVLKNATAHCRKVLLTATPLQNSIMELFGLVSFIDENTFGDIKSFKSQFVRGNGESEFEDLRDRIKPIVNRTLRKHVQEYINYTNRIPITEQFEPTNDEQALYEMVTEYLQRDNLQALPVSQRHLMTLILRKLLASSTFAIASTLESLINRLKKSLEDNEKLVSTIEESISSNYELFEEVKDEWNEENEEILNEPLTESEIKNIKKEIIELEAFYDLANSIEHNAKGLKLIIALNKGFQKLNELGANDKAIIFTESVKTQNYLYSLLEKEGYKDKIILFNGTNNDEKSNLIYKSWIEKNRNSDRISGAKAVDMRAALVDYFKSDKCQIMIATEAASEGINLQFCSMLVNYDLPWNPQRIEQRIGRCHRYKQKYDVIVINFLNIRNAADRRVFQLLDEKFQLFNGVFGASDEILGSISSGVDFEKRIADIYQQCRSEVEITESFDLLQKDLEEQINTKIKSTQQKLMENFDIDVVDKLKTKLAETEQHISKYEQLLWSITKFKLDEYASFDDKSLSFMLNKSPLENFPVGPYTLSKTNEDIHRYRLGHPVAQHIINDLKQLELPHAELTFSYSKSDSKITSLEKYIGRSGVLSISNIEIKSFDETDHILFSSFTAEGDTLSDEECYRLLTLPIESCSEIDLVPTEAGHLDQFVSENKEKLIETLREKDHQYYQAEVDKLNKWAEDRINASEDELKETKKKIKELERESRTNTDTKQLVSVQTKLKELERKKRILRQEIFDVEDEIEQLRDNMIDEIKKRMQQSISETAILTIKWHLI